MKGEHKMNFSAVYHRAYDNYCYPIDSDRLVVSIMTGYDVKKVTIIQGDPFKNGILGGGEGWNGERLEVPFQKQLSHHIWWTTTLEPDYKRLKYYFELETEDEKWYYFEDGFLTPEQFNLEGRSKQFFVFPWMNPCDVAQVPQWVNNTIWYQIFPERFCNGDPSINPENVREWREEGSVLNSEFFGGDLQGILNQLDYLDQLGIGGIYLTPINTSPTSHKYDTTDYREIDPHFGSLEVFQKLVQEAHKRNIKVMVDGVFNHCGTEFEPWKDVVKYGPKSKFWNWFMINKWPFDFANGAALNKQYYSFAFFDQMPKLNTNHPEVREYFINICKEWIKEYDVDGIRLDVANEVSHTFCKELHRELKQLKPEIYILGEIWHDAMPWLRGDEFDAVMNYPLAESIQDFWVDKTLTKKDFEYTINRCYTRYMQQTNDVLFNLLDSHDTKRLRSNVANMDEYYQQLATLFIMPGSPCIFYGTEIGMEGSFDPDCRRCMPWQRIAAGEFTEITNVVKELIELRKKEPLLRSRNFHFPNRYSNPRVIEISKLGWIDNVIEIVINCSKEEIEVENVSQVLFKTHYDGGRLLPNGILIYRA